MTLFTSEINDFNECFYNFNFSKKSPRVLVVFNAWRGRFDTLKLFVDTLSEYKIFYRAIDWKINSWILDKGKKINLDIVDDIANKFKCNIVLLLGKQLVLNKPVSLNNHITYASYYISSIQNTSALESFNFTHFLYCSHSHEKNILSNFKWLPQSVNSRAILNFIKNKTVTRNNKVLCLWNDDKHYKTYLRLKMLEDLRKSDIDHLVHGTLTNNQVGSGEAISLIKGSKLVLDDNRGIKQNQFQFNDRFSLSCLLKTPVVTNKCDDLDLCFDSYLYYNKDKSFIQNIYDIINTPIDLINTIVYQNYKKTLQCHRNEFRWSNIFFDHYRRINEL
jgi:hypothetical protein